MSVFKAYDIRGVYPREINETLAYMIGRAFVIFLSCKKVVVGRDARLSSPSLFEALTRGITDQGADVMDIGVCTTPLVSFAVASKELDAGIMISASHNPSQYNAFKIIGKRAVQLHKDTGIENIRQIVEKGVFPDAKKGRIIHFKILEDYISHIMSFVVGIKGIKIVVDYGNGVGSITAKPVFAKLPIKVIGMFEEPDGTFPNHPANPHDVENIAPLQKKVLEEKADVGLFFDGDGDRCLFVDEHGKIVFPDLLLALLAQAELAKHTHEKVYFDLRFSRVVKDVIERSGGIPVMMRVGNPYYKEKLVYEGGVCGGEFSGHMFFRDNYCIDDGLFAAIKLLSLLSSKGRPLSELINPLKVYFSSEEISLHVKDTDSVIEKVRREFSDGENIELDGLLIQYSDWWFSLRKSNTEPLVRLRLEANTAEKLERMRSKLFSIIKS
ncbi:MAG: phosphomannomutase/phosphoglucomutase [Candidatus Woesearchaeota archaeon]